MVTSCGRCVCAVWRYICTAPSVASWHRAGIGENPTLDKHVRGCDIMHDLLALFSEGDLDRFDASPLARHLLESLACLRDRHTSDILVVRMCTLQPYAALSIIQ